MKNPQPAKKSYLLYRSFIELSNVITDSFKNCGKSISYCASSIIKPWKSLGASGGCVAMPFVFIFCLFPSGLALSRLLFTALFTPVICVIITIFQVVILILLFLIAFTLFVIFSIADWLFCVFHKIFAHCPYCGAKFSLPIYYCECGAVHDNLRPGIYGIFKRECNCGRKLSTSFLNGRHNHDAWCPVCNRDIPDDPLSSYCIPIVGGAGAGKTCYITMTMLSLENNASRFGLTFAYEKNDLDEYNTNVSSYLSKGKPPPKTTNYEQFTYYQFALTPRRAIKQMISLCDVAGEIYIAHESSDNITKQKALKYNDAFILLIDPLSIIEYRNEVAQTTDISGYTRSLQPIDEIVDKLLNTLKNIFNLKQKELVKTNVAVVFTKVDIPGLSQMIGKDAIRKYSSKLDIKTRYQTQNKLCEDFLKRYHEEHFLKILKRFKNVQFFTCSALGHPENGSPFVSKNVEEPFFWIMSRINKVITKTLKKHHKI